MINVKLNVKLAQCLAWHRSLGSAGFSTQPNTPCSRYAAGKDSCMASALSCDLAALDDITAPVVWSKGALPSDALRKTLVSDGLGLG